MGWSFGWDSNWNRDIGYGVPAWCDHPKCNSEIDRGLYYVCCGQKPYGGYGDRGGGCGLYFCSAHQRYDGKCPRCSNRKPPYKNPKPDHPDWLRWKLRDSSWKRWRASNPDEVNEMRKELRRIAARSNATSQRSQEGA